MGFDLVQGYLFGKPMGVRKFARSRLLPASAADPKPWSRPPDRGSLEVISDISRCRSRAGRMVMQRGSSAWCLSLAQIAYRRTEERIGVRRLRSRWRRRVIAIVSKMRGFLVQPPSVCTLMTSLVIARQRKRDLAAEIFEVLTLKR